MKRLVWVWKYDWQVASNNWCGEEWKIDGIAEDRKREERCMGVSKCKYWSWHIAVAGHIIFSMSVPHPLVLSFLLQSISVRYVMCHINMLSGSYPLHIRSPSPVFINKTNLVPPFPFSWTLLVLERVSISIRQLLVCTIHYIILTTVFIFDNVSFYTLAFWFG